MELHNFFHLLSQQSLSQIALEEEKRKKNNNISLYKIILFFRVKKYISCLVLGQELPQCVVVAFFRVEVVSLRYSCLLRASSTPSPQCLLGTQIKVYIYKIFHKKTSFPNQ